MKTALRLFALLAIVALSGCKTLEGLNVTGQACYPLPGGGTACATVGGNNAPAPLPLPRSGFAK